MGSQRTASSHSSSNNLSSATLKTSPLAASLPPCRVASSAAAAAASQQTCAATDAAHAVAAAMALAETNADAKIGHAVAAAPATVGPAVERVSIGVGECLDTATKAIAVDLGCDGDERCTNGKGVEALGVLLQYLVFHVSVWWMGYMIYIGR